MLSFGRAGTAVGPRTAYSWYEWVLVGGCGVARARVGCRAVGLRACVVVGCVGVWRVYVAGGWAVALSGRAVAWAGARVGRLVCACVWCRYHGCGLCGCASVGGVCVVAIVCVRGCVCGVCVGCGCEARAAAIIVAAVAVAVWDRAIARVLRHAWVVGAPWRCVGVCDGRMCGAAVVVGWWRMAFGVACDVFSAWGGALAVGGGWWEAGDCAVGVVGVVVAFAAPCHGYDRRCWLVRVCNGDTCGSGASLLSTCGAVVMWGVACVWLRRCDVHVVQALLWLWTARSLLARSCTIVAVSRHCIVRVWCDLTKAMMLVHV